MASLTAAQLQAIGNNFLAIAQVIGDYRLNAVGLDPNSQQDLSDLHLKILTYADDLFFTSAAVALDDAQAAVTQITALTEQINKDVSRLTEVQKIINVAGSVITLGASIISTNPSAILNGITGLAAAVGALSE